MALRERVAAIVDPPPPPPPPNEPRNRRTLRSSTSFSPNVGASDDVPVAPMAIPGATDDVPVAPTDSPPWLDDQPPPYNPGTTDDVPVALTAIPGTTDDVPVAPADSLTWLTTRPPPSETQTSSQTLLSQPPVQADEGRIQINTTTAALGFGSHGDDVYIPVTATRGRRMTRASAAFLPPETVGIPPQTDTTNAFAAFDDALSVTTPDRPVEERRDFNSASIQAVVDKSFAEFYGTDAPSDPTSRRFKGFFDEGARMVDRILSDIREDQKRHEGRTTQHLGTINEAVGATHRTLRTDVSTLRTETEDALVLLRREMTAGLDTLFQKANATTSAALQLVMQPTVKAIDGLTATAHELEAKVTDLSQSSARATQDILFLRQDLDGGGDLAELAALARRSEQAVLTLMATTKKNAQAIRDLRLEIAGCTTLKETVDDIKNRQLHHIRDNIKDVGSEVTDMKNKYATLDTKYSDAFDAVNTRVDDILRDGIPPTPAQTTIPPSSPPAVDASIPTPANVVPTSAPPRDSMDGPPPDDIARPGGTRPGFLAGRPNLPEAQEMHEMGSAHSVRWRPQLDPGQQPRPNGAFQRETPAGDDFRGGPRPVLNPYFGSHDTRNESARSDPRRYTAHVPPHSRRPSEVDVAYESDDEAHLPKGGQIMSPRHWDRRQVAHTAGHSPLDAAALACREYHGYQRGYYPLTAEIITSCGYRDTRGGVSPYCNDIILLHRRVMDAWENRRTQQRGPSVDRILEKGLPVFPRLDTLEVSATVDFYDKLHKTSALFLLPLMLFDAINLNTGFEGLCPPGLGLQRYAEIAGVFMEILPRLLPSSDSHVTSLVMVVRAESNNGFDLLWRILELAVPGFDPSHQISAPVWNGEDIFEFCLSFVLYFRLQAKKGLVHDERTKSLTFLQAVQEPAYVDVITTLQAHIDTYLAQHDFGYLPPTLCMMGLATQMNKNARARVREVFPRVARRLAWDQDGWHPSTPEIQGYHIPRVCRTETPRDRGQYANSRTPERRFEGRVYGRGAPRPSPTEAPHGSNRRPERDGQRGRYARPDHNRRQWDPDITCAACKRRGHPAASCDMLAMALFLEKYTRSIGSADRDKIEKAWLLRWKENLGNPSRLPRKVMKAYLEYMDISAETLDDQMDWECWPVDDAVEEFEFDTTSDSTPSL